MSHGGFAFPRSARAKMPSVYDKNMDNYEPGMTLRDYYSGEAMKGMLAARPVGSPYLSDDDVDECWNCAQSMIDRRP